MMPFNDNLILSSYFEVSVTNNAVKLLPFGHSRNYPLEFDVNNRNVISGKLNFFNSPLHTNFQPAKFIDPDKCETILNKTKNSLIIINLLDNCFGHSLLKLFSSIDVIDTKSDSFDFLLIIPAALRHFLSIRPGVSVMYISMSFSQLEGCYVLNNEIRKTVDLYTQIFLTGAETYHSFDLPKLTQKLNFFDKVPDKKAPDKIIFYYRADYSRMWNGKRQGRNVTKLFTFLKPFFAPNVQFVVVGDKDAYKLPSWIKDERITKFSNEVDFHYNRLFDSALICIGLTGSHMLFPSILTTCTVHLHPGFKYKNMAEDIVVNKNANEMLSAYKHLYYYGNYNCSDLTPAKLASIILIQFQGLVEKEYKTGLFSKSQESWINENYQEFNYGMVSKFRSEENAKGNRKIRFRRLIDKYF